MGLISLKAKMTAAVSLLPAGSRTVCGAAIRQEDRVPFVSLKTKMTLAVALLVAALLGVTAGTAFLFIEKELKGSISRQQFTLVTAIAEEIDGKIRTTREHLEAVASMVPTDILTDRAAAQHFLDLQLDNRVLFDSGLFLASPRGELLAQVAGEPDVCREECPLEGWFRKTTLERRSQISDPFFWGHNERRPVILFTVPVFDRKTGEVRAVLGGSLDLLQGNFLGKLAEVRLGEGGYLYLYDRQRTLIVHPDRSRILQRDVPPGANRLFDAALEGFEGTDETTTSRGLEALSSFRRLQTVDWILAANYPVAEAYAPLERAQTSFALGLTLPLALASLVVWFLMRYLTAPLLALTDQVRKFGEGEEEPVPVRLRVGDEIGALAQVFNRMAQGMAGQRRGLEKSLSLLRATLEATADGILVIDLDGTIVSYNSRFAESWPQAAEVLAAGDGRRALASFLRQLQAPTAFSNRIRDLHLRTGEESRDTVTFRDGRIFEFLSRPQRQGGSIVGRVWSFRDVTLQRRTLDQLRKVSCAVEQSPNFVMITDVDGSIEYVNPRFTEVTGFSPDEAVGRNPISLLHGDAPEEYYRTLRETISAGREWRGEVHNRKKNGESYWGSTLISPVKNPEGVITHFVAIEEDITEKKLAERRQQLTAQVLSLLSLASEKTDKVRDILQLIKDFTGCKAVGILLRENGGYRALGLDEAFHAAEYLLRADARELADCLCGQVLLGRTDPALPWFTAGGCFWAGAAGAEAPEDAMRPYPCAPCRYEGYRSLALIPLRSGEEIIGLLQLGDGREGMLDSGLVGFLEGLAASIGIAFEHRQTEGKLLEKEERLHYLTNYDPLTGLPNRVLLRDRLRHALAKARRSGRPAALLLIDLDRFKTVNDSLGHVVGDWILQQMAGRLQEFVREADTLARVGGDEFAVLLEEVGEANEVTAVAQKILRQLAHPIEFNGIPIHLTGSVGISLFPADAMEMESLMKFTEIAMYRAKGAGRNSFQFYRPEMNARSRELLLLENSLHQALGKRQLVLFYQPQFDLTSGEVRGVEALLRWRHPELGLVPPGDFIPLAEESGLIVPIGEWVLRTACVQGREWAANGWPGLRMAVNISGRQFQQPGFVDLVDGVLQETGLDPGRLELELTESILMTEVEANIRVMTDLRARGIRLAIDDFGTGYSSLSYLKRFPITSLKIDRSFVRDVTTGPNDAVIATSVVALAEAMRLNVVAEGIETEEQLRFLSERGCTEGQGYLFSRPLPAEEMTAFLGGWTKEKLLLLSA